MDLENRSNETQVKSVCGHCNLDLGSDQWECRDCKIALCDFCQKGHLNIPMLKSHKIMKLEREKETKFFDALLFCKHHPEIPLQLNCLECSDLICYKCLLNFHKGHESEPIDEALDRKMPQFKLHLENNTTKPTYIQAQINIIASKVEETKESFAIQRIELDDQLEKVICRLRAAKAGNGGRIS